MKTRRIAPALVVSLALFAAACGSDSDSSSDTTAAVETTPATEAPAETTPAETTPAETTPAAPETSAAAAGVSAADRVAAFSQPVTELPFSEKIAEIPAGKKVYYVQCGVSACEEIRVGIAAAAEKLGWKLEITTHKDTPDTVAAAFDAAIAAKPDVVLTSGNPREWFAPQLKTLEEAGVPVIAWSIPESYEAGQGIVANLLTGDDYYFYGVLMADYASQKSAKKNVLFVGLPTFPVLSLVQNGFKDEIAKACPDCKVDTMEVAVTDLGTNLPGQIVSKLQANPDLDFIVYAFGGMLFGVPEAIEAAGLLDQAKAISQAGGTLNFGFIANDKHQVAEVGLASELLGWRALDVAARVLSGSGPGRVTPPAAAAVEGHPDILVNGLPLQILEKGSIADPTKLWPGVDGFQDKFAALWGK
jgi:ABC-type sugar transport system substrate-binding protein